MTVLQFNFFLYKILIYNLPLHFRWHPPNDIYIQSFKYITHISAVLFLFSLQVNDKMLNKKHLSKGAHPSTQESAAQFLQRAVDLKKRTEGEKKMRSWTKTK